MRITYDADADAAYIALVDAIADGAAAQQLHSIVTPGGLGEVTLDFDREGRILGIEVLNASAVLPPAALAAATS
jgi:uncharacterized protein YuzE